MSGGAAAGASGGGSAPGGTSPGSPGGSGDPTPGGVAGGMAGGGTMGGPCCNGAPPGGALSGLIGGTGGVTGGGGALGGILAGAGGGSTGGASLDAGAPPTMDAGWPSGTEDAQAGVDGSLPDAGTSDGAVEAGPVGDAGLCPNASPARVDGGCQGSYCGLTFDAFSALTLPVGACNTEATLRLVCDAQLARKTAQCAQDNALSLALGSAVRSCLRRDPQLSAVGDPCVDCYVDELLCTLSNCLAVCVAGFDMECSSCRRARCGAEFTRCSGLPAL